VIKKIIKDFTQEELFDFQTKEPERYDNLCKIIGEYEFAVKEVSLVVELPYKEDYGVVSVFTVTNSKTDLLGIRPF